MVAVYPGLVVRDMRSVDELTFATPFPHCVCVTFGDPLPPLCLCDILRDIVCRYGVLSSPPAVHYIARWTPKATLALNPKPLHFTPVTLLSMPDTHASTIRRASRLCALHRSPSLMRASAAATCLYTPLSCALKRRSPRTPSS